MTYNARTKRLEVGQDTLDGAEWGNDLDLREPDHFEENETSAATTCSASSVLAEIEAEITRATAKFPTWPTDAVHAAGVVAEEMGELQKEVMQLTYEPHKSTKDSVRKEAVQLAAMAIRFLMSLDRYEYAPGPQHSQQNVQGQTTPTAPKP